VIFRKSWTVADLFRHVGVNSAFVDDYFVPMASAIWSASPESILSFPAHFMVGFCRNHGLLQLLNRPQWKTIPGGSRTYVDALTAPIRHNYRLNSPVASVTRTEDHVVVTTAQGEVDIFDQVVFATHADQTLRILQDATERESRILSAFPYQPNTAIVHTDTRLLPQRRAAWASWNYRVPSDGRQAASVTYDLSRLQGHDSPKPILLTLNPVDTIDPDQVLRELHYDHPAYSVNSVRAQGQWTEINGHRRTYFCGAYWGYGFHEDGVNSALAVARCFGKSLEQLESSEPVVETERISSLR
jgi:predicted NAD/FAD-binding protein